MSAPISTKVHPPETNADEGCLQPLWDQTLSNEPVQTFRHSGWHRDRVRIWEALSYFAASEKRLDRFNTCGLRPHLYRSPDPPYRYKIAGDSCRDRFCVPCARARGNIIAANILDKLDGQECRFLTLTLRSSGEPLLFLLDKIQRSFRKLRTTDTWKTAVSGGVMFIETKWNAEPGRWHVHLHALLQGRFVNKPDLEKHWRRITRGSYVCDLQHCPRADKVTRYVVKYCCKPYDHSVVGNPARLLETVAAFHRRRLFSTFGDWRGIPLLHRDPDETWTNLGLLADFITNAARGDKEAAAILILVNPTAADTCLSNEQVRAPPLPLNQPEPQLPAQTERLFPAW